MLDDTIVARARALMDDDGSRLLGLVGSPGAGKSTFTDELVRALGPHAVTLPMDGYHLSNRQLGLLGRSDRKGAPDTFDAHGYLALLRRIRAALPGEIVYAPAFHREIEESLAASIAVPPEIGLVVTEGNYLLLDDAPWCQVRDVVDEIWYLDVPAEIRRERLVARHMRFGRGKAEARDWVATVDEPNGALIEAGRSRASRVLPWLTNGSGRFGPPVPP